MSTFCMSSLQSLHIPESGAWSCSRDFPASKVALIMLKGKLSQVSGHDSIHAKIVWHATRFIFLVKPICFDPWLQFAQMHFLQVLDRQRVTLFSTSPPAVHLLAMHSNKRQKRCLNVSAVLLFACLKPGLVRDSKHLALIDAVHTNLLQHLQELSSLAKLSKALKQYGTVPSESMRWQSLQSLKL